MLGSIKSRIARLLATPDRRDRVPVYLAGTIRLSCGTQLPVVITDCSSYGCKIRSRQPLPVGEIVDLVVTGAETLRVSVRWWNSGEAGLQYT